MEEKECPCPECNELGFRIDTLSKLFTDIDFYECRPCSQVWTVPKEKCEPAELIAL